MKPPTIDQIAAVIEAETGVCPVLLRCRQRLTPHVRARRLFVGLVRELTTASYLEIAKWYGPSQVNVFDKHPRSHTTGIEQHKAHERLMRTDPEYAATFRRLAKILKRREAA